MNLASKRHPTEQTEQSPTDTDTAKKFWLWDFLKNKRQQQQQNESSWFATLLQLTCLKHNYTLRRQLAVGYGITAVATIFVVVVTGIVVINLAGMKVKNASRDLFRTQLDSILQSSAELTADILDKKMNHLRGSVNLLAEVVRDRIVGYPDDGWENDMHVPFVDRYTGRRMYPLRAKLLPRDWMIQPHLLGLNRTENTSVFEEHFQERSGDDMWMPIMQDLNTQTPMFSFQGICDPNSTNPDQVGYYPFCTDENNDASLGGKINPTDTLAGLEQKAADIGVFVKAIYEAQPLAISAGVVFVNSGAGAGLYFPSFNAPPNSFYTSAGCDWMREINPYTGRPLGTDEEIKRCTPAGIERPLREYNGMTREWCADQALHPGETRIFGPYEGAVVFRWRLTFGRAVFDRKTGELIACTHIDLALPQAQKLLRDVAKDMPSDLVLTKVDGTVVVDTTMAPETLAMVSGESNNNSLAPKLWETDFIDLETYRTLTDDLAFWETEWDIESARKKYKYSVNFNGKYYNVVPSPMPPDEYDPLYKPDFYIFGSIDAEVEDYKIGEIDDIIQKSVNQLMFSSIVIVVLGLCCMMAVVTTVSQVLTQPLQWMQRKAWEIVNHTDERVGGSMQMSIADGSNSEDDDGDSSVISNFNHPQIHSFVPETEIQELVKEFSSMISGFSGMGASTVAHPKHTETKNLVMWKEEFRKFYSLSGSMDRKLKEDLDLVARSVSRRLSKKSAMRKMSRAGSFRRNSFRRSSKWNNATSLPMSASDFEKIVAAADEAEQEDSQNNNALGLENPSPPLFRSTQMGDASIAATKSKVQASAASLMSSETAAAASISSSFFKSETSQFSELLHSPTRINLGSNIHRDVDQTTKSSAGEDMGSNTQIIRSRLYLSIFCGIVIPLLTAIIAIMSLVSYQLVETSAQWINEANKTSFDLDVEHLKSSTNLIVKHIEQTFGGPLHDLHTIHRIAGWLLHDAVNLSDSFIDIEMEMTEDCKDYLDVSKCPFYLNKTRSLCVCEWNCPWGEPCTDSADITPPADPRYDQKLWYLNQDRNRNKTFPEIRYSPNTTYWYTNPDDMPGSEAITNSQGHSTEYDRVRVASALSAIIFPVYNHGIEDRAKGPSVTAISGYVSFEADGAYGGFSGCNYDAAAYSQFVSTDANKAYEISDLCPKGQYGYDPRCRGWYDTTKRQAIDANDRLYISPPYAYAASTIVGITAASPLMDPKSDEFIGTALIDFHTTEIKKVVEKTNVQYYAVILPNTADGQNVIASSEFDDQSTAKSIFDLMMPYDAPDSTNRKTFEQIIRDMEVKGTGEDCHFFINDDNGDSHQNCYVYKPIFNRELRPVQPDDFERGAQHSTEFLYSVIMYQDVDSILSEFVSRRDDIGKGSRTTNFIYIMITSLTTLLCIIATASISLYITRPIIQLLCTVKQVNSGGIEGDMPPLTGGSQEVHQVYASFAKLYKTVRMSNSAFFVGDLNLAHRIARDALRLFRKIGDQKAIGIACNNMGNTLLAWMVECREPGNSLLIEDEDCDNCTEAAIKYYTEAVACGTTEFEAAYGDAVKAQYAQQLADRHFNRAMCLLLTADDPCSSDDARENALDDLFLAKQYDQGVKEYMLHSMTLLENSDVIFERYLRRLHGLTTLMDIEPDVWDVWDIYQLVDDADLMLQAAWNQDKAPLFHNITKIGRLQELEGAVTGIEYASGNANDAIQLATRMLVEDEYLLDSSFIEAADCILQCVQDQEEEDQKENEDEEEKILTFSDLSNAELRKEFKRMRKPAFQNSLDIGRTFIFCIDLKGEWNGQSLLLDLRKCILTFYEENFQPNDAFGMVTFRPNDGSLEKVRPSPDRGLFGSVEYPPRDAIVDATTGVACSRFSPTLQGGVEMALECEPNAASDVYLLYVSDGGAYDETIFAHLRNQLETSSRASRSRLKSKSVASAINLVIIGLGGSQEYLANRSSMSLSIKRSSHSLKHASALLPTTSSTSFAESCKSIVLATRSRASVYLEADPNHLESSFRAATASINEGLSFAGNRLKRTLTMQKF